MSRGPLPFGYDFASPSPDLVGYWRAYVPNVGTFYIRRIGSLWHPMAGDESLGSYPTPADAHKALISGLTARPSSGVDPSKLNLMADLSEWPFYTGAAPLARTTAPPRADVMPGSAWHFVREDDSPSIKWTWRRMRIEGTIESVSEPQAGFGRAVADAVEHGFRPKQDAYVVIAGGTYTHFRPGQSPLTVPHDATAGLPPIANSAPIVPSPAANAASSEAKESEVPVRKSGSSSLQ